MTHKLDLQWTRYGCQLYDKPAKKAFRLAMHQADKNVLDLCLVSYKQYSQSFNTSETSIIPPDYKALIDQYPAVLQVNFHKKPKHDVVHHIDMGQHPPCRARPRPILKG